MSYSQNIVDFAPGETKFLNVGNGWATDGTYNWLATTANAIFPSGMDTGVFSLWLFNYNAAFSFIAWQNGTETFPAGYPYFPNIHILINPGSGFTVVEFDLAESSSSSGFAANGSVDTPQCAINTLISFQKSTSTLQIYINDVAMTPTITNTETAPLSAFSSTALVAEGVGFAGDNWGADLWFGTTGEFVDLTVESNRRKFINADLTPVDLGSTGQNPFGSSPQFYQSVRTSEAATAWLTNKGTSGGVLSLLTGTVALNGNPCAVTPPPIPPTGSCGTATATSVTFTWMPDPSNPDPDSYTLQYGPHGTDPSTWTTVTGITGTSYTITVAVNTSWDWQIEAIYSGTPTGFSTTYTCETTVTLPFSTQFLSCGNGFTITAPITKMWGFDHLIGMSVVGLLDGILMPAQVVAADGSVTLPFAASNVKIGLPFTPQLQTPYLDAGQPTVQGRRKNISAVTARIEASLGVLAGANQPDGAAQQPPAIATTWGPMTPAQVQPVPSAVPIAPTYQSPAGQTVTKLVTGDMRTVVTADWQIPGQVAIQGTPGLPLNVLDCVPELLEGDTTEQTYAQREPREPRGGPGQPPARGPGLWMLRR